MGEFSPLQAAQLADDVYTLTSLQSSDDAVRYLQSEYGHAFSFAQDNMLKGKTGGPAMIKVRTAFGFMLLGKGTYDGHAVILFRGTQYLADWLTNLNFLVSKCASGEPVHDGFNRAFATMKNQLRPFIKSLATKRIHSIHCIGHSLGGALATLCADWIYAEYKQKSYVYSFGSPRVGLLTFATTMRRNLGGERIFRAYHKTDIVPCLPIWPYYHTPHPGPDYYLPSPGVIPLKEYHGMNHYIDSVDEKSWPALAGLRNAERRDDEVARWLKEDSPVGLTITAIDWLNRALRFVLEKCLEGAGWLISRTFSSSFTLMDQLAYVLKRGFDMGSTASSWVLYLMRKIMRVLGMGKVVEAADITKHFLRTVLINLQQRVHHATQSILSQVLAKGRAV